MLNNYLDVNYKSIPQSPETVLVHFNFEWNSSDKVLASYNHTQTKSSVIVFLQREIKPLSILGVRSFTGNIAVHLMMKKMSLK